MRAQVWSDISGSGMTAAWCLAMAEKYPEVEVIGVGTHVLVQLSPLAL